MDKTLYQLAEENKQAYINACNAVIGRGGTVPSGMPASELATAITNIPNDQTLAYQKVASSTRRVTVPQNVEPVAIVNKIGGMTYKCKNLLPYPYDNTTKTLNGITYTDNGDGTITANGTATADSFFSFFYTWGAFNLSAGNYYFSGCASGGSGSTYRINVAFKNAEGTTMFDKVESGTGLSISLTEPATALYCRLTIGSGTTINNLVFKPMLNSGTSALPFEQYFEGLRNSKVTSIVSEGANLLDISKAINANFVDNGDRTYTMTNNGGVERFSKTFPIFIPANTTVTIKGFRVSGEINCLIQFRFADGTWWEDCPYFDGVARKRTPEKDIISARFFVNSGTANEGKPVTIRDVQIQYGTTATEYKPFVGTLGITTIPEAVTSREGYGEGYNSDYYNYVEWREGRYYEGLTCNKLVFNGTEGWYAGSLGTENQYFALEGYPLNAILNGGIMTDYSAAYVSSSNKNIGWQLYKTDKFLLRLRPANVATDFPTLADWKSYLATRYANGNPLTFLYALAEPIETDITDLMTVDNAIVVEGGGTQDFITEHGYDMPSETTYLINTAGG